MLRKYFIIAVFQIAFIAQIAWAAKNSSLLSAQVLDGDMGGAIACRVYIQGEDGKWYFPRSASDKGSAFVYQKQNWANKNSLEMHTTLSAHGFEIELLPGKYTVTIERGKEYFP